MTSKTSITRRDANPVEPRKKRIVARITSSQREEIADISKKMRVNDSAFIRMAAKMAATELEKGTISADEFIDTYGPTT